MIKKENKVSVIMPAYNVGKTIAESIESVLRQEYIYWELIIIDDRSVDNTVEIVNLYLLKDERIKLISLEQNGGLPNARNEGIKIAEGAYISFLDSDDVWLPSKLKIQVSFHKNNPLIRISHTKFKMFNDKGFVRRPLGFMSDCIYKRDGNLFTQFLYKNVVGILTVMIEKDLINEVDGFDTKLWGLEDQDLWIRVAKKNVNFGYINQALSLYRISDVGMMKNLSKYKKAYRSLINKHKVTIEENGKSNLTWSVYYKYFGTEYYKKNQFRLSVLYFWKSISLSNNLLLNFTTILYVLKVKFVNKSRFLL